MGTLLPSLGPAFPTLGAREKKSGRQSVAENPFAHAEDRMACNDHFTVLKPVSATLLACRRCPLRPRPVSAVSRRRGMEKRRQGRMGYGRTYVLYKSQGDASRRPRCGPASAPSMRLRSSPFSGVESTPLPTTLGDERRESYLRIWRTVRRLQAAMPTCQAARASASKEPAGIA